MLPLLEEIAKAGGVAKPGEIYDTIAARLGLSNEARSAVSTRPDGRKVNLFERRVRWVRQTAVAKDLIDRGTKGIWALTQRANAKLQNIVRGTVLTICESDNGLILWANAEDALAIIEKASVELLCTSSPYPLLRSRDYGNLPEKAWLEWMLRLCEGWRELLTPTGSISLQLGSCWEPGHPVESTYIERLILGLKDHLGLHLLQRLYTVNPTHLPTPLEWVGIRRLRIKQTVEPLLWFSANPFATADNRRVLKPYSESGRRAMRDQRSGSRPCGHEFGSNSFVDQGGAIPPSTIAFNVNNTDERAYRAAERAAGREPHPATWPSDVPAFIIALATEPGDIVYDPFAGSASTAVAAERLGRRWIMSERSKVYIDGARIRLESAGIALRPLVA